MINQIVWTFQTCSSFLVPSFLEVPLLPSWLLKLVYNKFLQIEILPRYPVEQTSMQNQQKKKRKNNRDTTNLFTKRLYISLLWQKKKSYDKQSFLWALKMHHLQGEQAINVFLLTKYVSWGNIVLFSLWDYNFENFILPKYSILKLNWKLERNVYSF